MSLSQFHGPGYFFVLSQPKSADVLDEYNEWYDSEHGPLRLKLNFILNGYRYKSQGLESPVYLATYDLKQISGLDEPTYKVLREKRSERETDILEHKLKYLDRRVYSDVSSRGRNGGPAPVVMAVTFVVKDDNVEELHRWYEEEHTDDISKIPGWRRTRRFKLVEGDGQRDGYSELLAVHDFERDNGLDGPEHERAKSRPWRNKVMGLVESRDNKRFEFFHEFDAVDYRKPPPPANDQKASTTRATSWVLEGPDDGPVMAFSNSLLTDLHIWDGVLNELRALYTSFRFLRYNTRGLEKPSEEEVTIDLLTDDLALLLDELDIKRCFAVVGVSLGGITALNFAIRYPHRLERFVACDCNAGSTAPNTQAWQDRVALANTEGGWEKLAHQTVDRWFTPMSVQSQTQGVLDVKKMILAASKPGFENCVGALCNFDLSQKLNSINAPGCCVVGAYDGVLPKAMAAFSKTIPRAWFEEIPNAGHLPMVENPGAFVQVILPLLELGLANHPDT